MNLNKLLRPKSIAVIGASEKVGFSSDTCKNILTYNPDLERVYFVNTKRSEVFGRKCYNSLGDIEDIVDLVIICTPKGSVIQLLREAHAKGCGGAVIYAAGYSEVGTDEGKQAEQELREVANELGIAIMGPNCVGFINYIDTVFAFACTSKVRDRKGHIGFISQSGQFCLTMLDSPSARFSYCISVGNSKVVQIEDYMDFLVEDGDTRVLALYLEGVTNPVKFETCLKKAAQKRKPIVILKAGRSTRGAALTSSHTGAMAGSDKVFDAIFKKFGVIRVDDLQDLLATASLLATMPALPTGTAVASMNVSGGETGICADMGYLNNISMPDLEQETKSRLKELLPFASPGNPLDTTAPPAYDAQLFTKCLLTVDSDRATDMILLGMTILDEINDSSMEIMYEGIRAAKEQGLQKPLAIVSFIETTHYRDLLVRYEKLGVSILPAPKYAFAAIRHMMDFITYRPEEHTLELAIPTHRGTARCGLSERESKRMLKDGGLDIDLGVVVKSGGEAAETAQEMGYPVVMKIESDEIQHKSDVGGVKLNIRSSEEAIEAYRQIMEKVSRKAPNASINGILVQKMLPYGKEFIVGVNSDPQFGPMLLVGMGGVFVEVFKDTALYPVPIGRLEAEKMIAELKSFKLLTGYRGEAPADIDALADMLVQISDFAMNNKNNLLELDINPVFVYEAGKGAGVADALVIIGK